MANRHRLTTVALVALLVFLLPSASPRAAQGPSGDYYYNAGRRVPIVRSSTRVALHVSGDAARSSALQMLGSVDGVRASRDIKSSGVIEVTVPDSKAVSTGLRSLGRSVGGSILPVFFEPGAERDESTLFISDEIVVQFRPDVAQGTIDALNARLGADVVEPLTFAPNGFKLRVNSGDLDRNAVTVANAYFETGLCLFAHPNFLAHRSLRFIPNDPQFTNQWHLKNTGQGGGTVGADVKAEQAWDITQGSTTISVAVADTGIDYHHEDLQVNIDGTVAKVHDPRDVVHADNDPFPQPGDADGSHGTAASGVAVAYGNNGIGVSGSAPKCRLVPIQLYAESTFTPNSTEADAFTWAADHADVMSNSWGPDNPGTLLPDVTRAAMDYCGTNGRGGKGTVIFFAAGNSNFNIDQNNNDTYSAYPGVVAVSATTNSDTKSSYSSFGQSIAVAAPSSGGSRSITTTDVTGSGGYSSGNYTSTFGGTSSACPLAAGVGALILSRNPNLTWRQVKSVISQSADKIDPGFGAYDALGHSIYYGYGRVNALRALQLAVAGGPDTVGLYTGGTFFLRDSNSGGPANAAFSYGAAGSGIKPLSGDWDGNGTSTVGIYDTATGNFFLRNTNTPGAADIVFSFGAGGAGYVPLVGDWDNNGTDTVGLYNPATGSFFLKNTNSAGGADITFQFGAGGAGYIPLVGDWNGDGTDTIGLYSQATGAAFLRNANAAGGADLVFTFGSAGNSYAPVTGDWDNDGSSSLGLYDPATGAFFVRNGNSAGPADWTFAFGVGGATPLVGNWDGY